MSEGTKQLIAARVYDPRQPSIFGKSKKSERANYRQIFCSCESCPLKAKQECVLIDLFHAACPYGHVTSEEGPTQRAGSYYKWVSDRKKQKGELGWPGFATKKLAFIGEYVYVPYSHASMCKAVPFLKHSMAFFTGTPFVKLEDWNLETVLMLIDFVPQAMMGGWITSYRTEEVPKFLAHLREVDPVMWRQLIAVRPEFDTEPNYVGRKALLLTLAHPIVIPARDSRYPVEWNWDGVSLTTTDPNCYSDTWGGIKRGPLTLTMRPQEDAEVVVADNSWVTDATVFVD